MALPASFCPIKLRIVNQKRKKTTKNFITHCLTHTMSVIGSMKNMIYSICQVYYTSLRLKKTPVYEKFSLKKNKK